jgi:hypothetical protein
MSTFPGSPKLLKGGLIVLAPDGTRARRVISLQYNPDTLTRSYQVQGVGREGGGERAQPFRLKGAAIETIKLDVEIDATDFLEHPEQNAHVVQFGIAPQLAALESLVNPTSRELLALNEQSQSGILAETNGLAPDVPRRARRSDALRNFENVAVRRKGNATETRGGPPSSSAPSHPGGLA